MLLNQMPPMKGFLITPKGMEDIAALEIKGLIGKNSKTNEAGIVFDIKNYEDLFKLCYNSQSAIGVFYLLSEFNYKDILNDFKKNLEKINFKDWLSKNTQFRVKCIKTNNNISTPEIEKKLGELIINHIQEKYNYKQRVNLENPEIIIFVYLLQNKCYVGIDFGDNLSKRYYKIFIHSSDIKGTIGYFLVRLAEYNKSETLIDTFSGSGTIPIEAALFASKFPINFFNKEKFIFMKFGKFKNYNFNKFFKKMDKEILDYIHENRRFSGHRKSVNCERVRSRTSSLASHRFSRELKIHNIDSSMKYLNYAKKNSKIAGADKKINFSRKEIEWLDTKFDKGSVDKIVTKLPSLKQKDINNIYNDFFYKSEFILNKKGKIVLIGDKE